MNKKNNDSIKELKEILSSVDEDIENEEISDLDRLKDLIFKHLNGSKQAEKKRIKQLYKSGHELTGENGIRKMLGAIDLEFFGKAYFPHYFEKDSPSFHRELDKFWMDGVVKKLNPLKCAKKIDKLKGSKNATAAPRNHAKSTNLTFKDVIHAICYAYKHFILILSDTFDQASGFLEAIKEELEENEAILEDFGDLKGKVWKEGVILTKTRIKVQTKGAGQKVRGIKHKNWRPDLVLLDDIENDENVRTPEQRKKLLDWFDKAVSECGDSYTDFFYIGTVLHYDSLLMKVFKKPEYKSKKYKAVINFSKSPLWDEWEKIYTDLEDVNHVKTALKFFKKNKKAMLKGTKVLWKEKASYYDLMCKKINLGNKAFNSELQNEPIDPEDCLFNMEVADYFNPLDFDFSDSRFEIFGFLDPSLGKSKKSDFSAIITIVKDKKTGYLYVIDADVSRRLPHQIIIDILEKAKWIQKTFKKKYKKFGVETNQFQEFLKDELARASAEAKIYLAITEVHQTKDKVLRIETLEPFIQNKYIKFQKTQRTLLEQLEHFPMMDHDDAPDALASCVKLATAKSGSGFVKIRRRR